jgi:Ca2+-binding EF-hand superfamily protein
MFTFVDLLEILSDNPQFTEDTAEDLLSALRELDDDGDGMIPAR